jgi:Na+/H+-translocating membrane pyrophosphatase
MRGSAVQMLLWATMLALAGIGNAIWAGLTVQTATFGAAVLAIVLTVAAILARRARRGPQPVTHTSFGTMIAAVGVATILFGLVFGHFIVYFGAGLIAVGLGRVAVELHHQRREVQRR